jgi:hypothetical protein
VSVLPIPEPERDLFCLLRTVHLPGMPKQKTDPLRFLLMDSHKKGVGYLHSARLPS